MPGGGIGEIEGAPFFVIEGLLDEPSLFIYGVVYPKLVQPELLQQVRHYLLVESLGWRFHC